MKLRPRRTAAAIAVIGLAAATFTTLTAANATTTPPWEPDVSLGTVALYNASGQVVTSGTDLNHIADYAVASTAANQAGTTKATLFFYTPQVGVLPGNWNGTQTSLSTTFPSAANAAPLTGPGFTKPVVKLSAADGNINADAIGSFPNNSTTDGYTNMYQVRMTGTGPGVISDGRYWATDILVTVTDAATGAGTWTQVYPTAAPPVTGTKPVAKSAAVTGTAKVGYTVGCTAAFTGSAVTSVKYAWKNNGATIAGATGRALALSGAYYGHRVNCVVTATNAYGSGTATSAARAVAIGAALRVTAKPKLSGTFKVKKSVKVTHGTWSPAATSYTYQWKRGGKAIAGAHKATYKLGSKDKGKKITCTVTAKKAGYTTASTTTASSKKVAK